MQYKKQLLIALLAGIALLSGCAEHQPVSTDATPTSPPNVTITDINGSGFVDQSSNVTSTPGTTTDPTIISTPTPSPTPTATPTPSPSPTPIPTVPAAPVEVNTDLDTYTFLVNREYPLSESYAPSDLTTPNIPFSFLDKTADKRKLRTVAAEALEELYQAALAEEGLSIYGVSGYRSYDRQYDIYGTNLINKGLRHTNSYSAAPGTSEHQTGLAIDVSCASINYSLVNSFASTPEGIWLKENCWRFGFILRYPKDKESITGYAYEPWHIRYVGVPLAYYLYQNNLTLDEYYGTKSRYSISELATIPLIDLTSTRFYQLYATVKNSLLITLADGSYAVSAASGFPYVCEPIAGTSYYNEPIWDKDGKLLISENDTVCYKKPYFDATGNLWVEYDNSPAFLDPLWNADGTIAKDSEGNILFSEPVVDGNGNEFITDTGGILQKLPIRLNGELTYYMDGSVIFYEPFIIPELGYFFYDAEGMPLFSQDYYSALEALARGEEPDVPDITEIPEQPEVTETPVQPEIPEDGSSEDFGNTEYPEPEPTPLPDTDDEYGNPEYPVG